MLLVGVDVGTGSARAMVYDTVRKKKLSKAEAKTQTWSAPDLPQHHFEQSTANIWQSVCEAVKAAVTQADVDASEIKGLGFCATCSLVALDNDGNAVSVSTTGKSDQNVILWADHRATSFAAKINATQHDMLRLVGGSVSAEMELPKILWLKENLPTFEAIGKFMSLGDYLTYRATGNEARSLNSLVCKWNYDSWDQNSWNQEFLGDVGLECLTHNNFGRIGSPTQVQDPGSSVGTGLSASSAVELGLSAGTPVGTALIDAHAGALGMLHAAPKNSLAVIAGTSNCLIALGGGKPTFIPGIWGGAFTHTVYCCEAGQSAAGQFVDYMIKTHPAHETLSRLAQEKFNGDQHACLESEILSHKKWAYLTRNLHITPDVNGNRSPLGNPEMSGVFSGIDLHGASFEHLAITYLACLQSLAYSTRMIVDEMRQGGISIEHVVICGGLAKSTLFLQCYADALKLSVIVPAESEATLLGSCVLASVASGQTCPDLGEAARRITNDCEAKVIKPNSEHSTYHDAKYKVFTELTLANQRHVEMMQSVVT